MSMKESFKVFKSQKSQKSARKLTANKSAKELSVFSASKTDTSFNESYLSKLESFLEETL